MHLATVVSNCSQPTRSVCVSTQTFTLANIVVELGLSDNKG